MIFGYDNAILERYPSIIGGVILITDVTIEATQPDLLSQYYHEQQATIARIGDGSLSEIPSIEAWRRVFADFGVPPTKYRNAGESLLRRLTKKGDIPSINNLVDIGNMVSIRYALPVAVFDLRHVQGGISVRFAQGHEHFEDLGASGTIHPESGEVIFTDENGMVIARRWCWRQSAISAVQEGTNRVLVTVEGHHIDAIADVRAALNELSALLDSRGTMRSDLLSKENPVFH